MKQGAAAGAALQFSQGHSCPQRKLAKRKRTLLGTIQFPGLRQFRGAVTIRLVPGVCACGTVRCKHSDRIQWIKQRAAVGNVGEVLPRQKQPSRSWGRGLSFARARRRSKQKQGTTTRSSAPIFARAFMPAEKIGQAQEDFTGYHTVSGSPAVPRSRSAPARSRRLCLRHGTMQTTSKPDFSIRRKTIKLKSPPLR